MTQKLHALLMAIVPKLPSDYVPYSQRSRSYVSDDDDGVSDCSCDCKHFQVLKAMPNDWGVCANAQSPRCGLLTLEHQGCREFESGTAFDGKDD